MIPDEEDIRRRINAETSYAHLKDQARIIEGRAQEAKKLLEPIRARGRRNHFLEEAQRLMDRRKKGE